MVKRSNMRKLLILPGACDALGGTLVTLSLLVQGLEQCDMGGSFKVLVQADSIMENYLRNAGQHDCMQIIPATSQRQFFQKALAWVNQQPQDHSLLLDNCVERSLLSTLLKASPALRLSRRAVYHFCHDLALSYNYLGYLLRKLTFICLAPHAICNSQFTVQYIRSLMPNIQGVLYQPVDIERFNSYSPATVPAPLQAILDSGAKIILTPSRINKAGIVNDKNLRALIPLLVQLKAEGHHYHSIIVGEDRSPEQINTQALLIEAALAGVADRLTVLPPTFAIEDYYKHVDVVVTLAPREPFGRTVVEAIACGVPVVGSCTGGIGEILNHFASNWAVDPNDVNAVAKTIVDVVSNANTADILAHGQKWVEKNCSISEYCRQIIKITNMGYYA